MYFTRSILVFALLVFNVKLFSCEAPAKKASSGSKTVVLNVVKRTESAQDLQHTSKISLRTSKSDEASEELLNSAAKIKRLEAAVLQNLYYEYPGHSAKVCSMEELILQECQSGYRHALLEYCP